MQPMILGIIVLSAVLGLLYVAYRYVAGILRDVDKLDLG